MLKIERASDKCINLSLTKVRLQFVVREKGKTEADERGGRKYSSVVVGNPFASLFKDVRIKLNGVTVTEADGLYPYVSQHLFRTKIPPIYRKAVEQSGKIYEDYEDTRMMPVIGDQKFRAVGLDPLLWEDLEMRKEIYSIGSKSVVDICVYPFTDLTTAPQPVILPPSVTVDIELIPNTPERTIIVDKVGAGSPVVLLRKAELIVPRILPQNQIPKSISHQFMRIKPQPIIIPEKTTNYYGVVTFNGPIPSRLSLVFASMASFDGTYADNIYASCPRDVESIVFSVGGTQYPATPIQADFSEGSTSEMYLRTCESLRFSLDRTQQSLGAMDDYQAREFLYSVDISPDFSSDSNWTTRPEEGSVSVALRFSKPTPDQCVAILLAETVNTLLIQDDEPVLVE